MIDNNTINQNKSKSDLILALLAIAGLFSFLLLYDGVFPWSGIKVLFDRSEVTAIGENKLTELGYESMVYEHSVRFRRNSDLIRFLQREYDIPKADSLLRYEIPGYYWSVTWQKPELKAPTEDSLTISISSQDTENSESEINLHLTQQGELLAKVIKEITIKIHSNDIFVFYTDRFSEAMNPERQEFGEQRLQEIIESDDGGFASHILNLIENKVKTFVGNTPQHDDMTMVIVKVV